MRVISNADVRKHYYGFSVSFSTEFIGNRSESYLETFGSLQGTGTRPFGVELLLMTVKLRAHFAVWFTTDLDVDIESMIMK